MRKHWRLIICFALLIMLLIVLVIYNIKNNAKFFELPISSLLTLFTAIFISFYLVQKNTDQRYQKQIYCDLLIELQKLISNPEIYVFNKNTDISDITVKKRTLSNYLRLINSHSKKFGLEKETEFILDKFKEYDDLIGNHISDISYLIKSKKELQRPLVLINDKLYEMMLKIYN